MSSDDVNKMQKAFSNMSQIFTQGVLLSGWKQAHVSSIKNFDELLEEPVKSSLVVAERFVLMLK